MKIIGSRKYGSLPFRRAAAEIYKQFKKVSAKSRGYLLLNGLKYGNIF